MPVQNSRSFLNDSRDRGRGSGVCQWSDLTVSLELTGAHAESSPYGAKVIVTATGRELTAQMEVRDAGTLTIRVNDRDRT